MGANMSRAELQKAYNEAGQRVARCVELAIFADTALNDAKKTVELLEMGLAAADERTRLARDEVRAIQRELYPHG